ncbi:hypothetical protein GCM10010199_71020 [Dactylosporangium roseum]
MRLRIEVMTTASELPWPRVLAPGRGLAYNLLAATADELAQQLHSAGWGPFGMVPFGYCPPTFPRARRRSGTYAVGGTGFVELGSPLPSVIHAWIAALQHRDVIDWGGVALHVTGLSMMEPPEFDSGRARMRTETPVVLKVPPSSQLPGQTWLLPAEPQFPEMFNNNLIRKAQTLGLHPDIELDEIMWVGPKRSFAVGRGAKPGAAVEVVLSGAPETLRALWSWGLGQANSAGFGWIGTFR